MPEAGNACNSPVVNSGETSFLAGMIDRSLLVFSAVSVFLYAFVLLRTMEIGWSTIDNVHLGIFAATVVVALFRGRISSGFKAFFITIVSLSIGFAGLYSLGLLAGGVWYFPIAVIVLALSSSRRIVALFSVFTLVVTALIGVAYSRGVFSISAPPESLLTSLPHWAVFVLCIGACFFLGSRTIFAYRKAMRNLLKVTEKQREELKERSEDLEKALSEIKTLTGILPICSSCKSIRDDKGYWKRVEAYIDEHSDAKFSHEICPECARKLYPDLKIDDSE